MSKNERTPMRSLLDLKCLFDASVIDKNEFNKRVQPLLEKGIKAEEPTVTILLNLKTL